MTIHVAALVIVAVALALGAAISGQAGRWSWTAAPAGLAAAVLIAVVTVRLPGHGTTAAAAVALAVVCALIRARRARVRPPAAIPAAPLVLVVLVFCSLPFVANARFGELGPAVLDDLSFHMGQADAMRRLGADAHVTGPGYPVGPHALVAALSSGTGIGIAAAFSGLLLAVPVLLALTALSVLEGRHQALGFAAAVPVGVAYLPSAYLAQGAFKEPMLALFVLGFVAILREAYRAGRLDRRQGAALLLVTAAGAASFGATALVWPAAVLIGLAVLELSAGRRFEVVRRLRANKRPAVAGGTLLLVAALLVAVSSRDFFESGPGELLRDRGVGGNYVGQLNPLESLGVWRIQDFRLPPDLSPTFVLGLLIATSAVLFGLLWCRRRREWVLLAGVAGAATVYLVARPFTLAYFSGKALVVLAPILVLAAVAGLAAASTDLRGTGRQLAIVAFAAYAALACSSSAIALRGANVRPSERGPDVSDFRTTVKGAPALYLGRDNFIGWDLRGADVWGFQEYRLATPRLFARRPKAHGEQDRPAVDIDSIDSRFLDVFRYVVAPRTSFASRLPANFRLVRRSRWHLLFKRTGPSGRRLILAEEESPGAVLDCARGSGRRLSRRPGRAFVRPRPVVAPQHAWRLPDGAPATGVSTARAQTLRQTLRLAPGSWDLSLRYFSPVPLELRAGALRRSLPAYIGDRYTFYTAGRVVSRGGPITVEVRVPRRRRADVVRTVTVGTVAATRLDDPGHLVPLREACGKYVDWYHLDP